MSEGVEWAAHCAVVLGSLPPGLALPAAALADLHGVPRPYLAKSLQALSRAGLVAAKQGRGGGYALARPAAEVTLYDVVQAVEGPEKAFRCTEIRRRNPADLSVDCFRQTCQIAAAMWQAEKAYRDSLRGVTIADIAGAVAVAVPAAEMQKTLEWLGPRIVGAPQ